MLWITIKVSTEIKVTNLIYPNIYVINPQSLLSNVSPVPSFSFPPLHPKLRLPLVLQEHFAWTLRHPAHHPMISLNLCCKINFLYIIPLYSNLYWLLMAYKTNSGSWIWHLQSSIIDSPIYCPTYSHTHS